MRPRSEPYVAIILTLTSSWTSLDQLRWTARKQQWERRAWLDVV